LVGGDAATVEGHLHRAGGAGATLDRLDHVPSIGRGSVPHDLGVDPRSPLLGEIEILEYERGRTLAEYEAVARLVEWSTDRLDRFAGPGRAEPAHVAEPGMGHFEERHLRRSRDDRRAVAPPDRLGGLADTARSGRARG